MAGHQLRGLSGLELKGKSGNAYVKASAKLPSTVGTGNGPPPKKDKKKAGGGTSATCIGC